MAGPGAREVIANNVGFLTLFAALPGALFYLAVTRPYAVVVAPALLAYYMFNAIAAPEKSDGAPWKWLSQNFFLFAWNRAYTNLTLELPESGALDEKKMSTFLKADAGNAYVFGLHPHGVDSGFRVLMEGEFYETFPAMVKHRGWRTLAASVLFQIPIVRELTLWTGCVDASRKTAQRVLKRGRSVVVIPGGEAEQLITKYGVDQVLLKDRFGFVNLALEYGTKLVPAYVFGCVDAYYTSDAFFGIRKFIQKNFRVCINIFWGRVGLCCNDAKLTIVFGEPIDVPKMERPGKGASAEAKEEFKEAAAKYHKLYMEGLKAVYDGNKERLGFGDRELTIM